MRIPHAHASLSPAPRREVAAVGAERHAPYFMTVLAGDTREPFASAGHGGVPDSDCPVFTGRRESIAVGAGGHAVAKEGVSAETENFLAALGVPDFDRLVFAATGEDAPAVVA